MNKSFYEDKRERNLDLVVRKDGNYAFAPHFHMNIELLVVKSGRYLVQCNGREYQVQPGSVVFIDTYDIHGYGVTGQESLNDALIIIPFAFMERFLSYRNKARVETPIIKNAQLVDEILDIVEKYLVCERKRSKDTSFSAIDLILSLIEAQLVYTDNKDSNDIDLVKKILQYIEKNYTEKISLTSISKALGYTKEHLSRCFNKALRQSIPTYVNSLRLQYIDSACFNTYKNLNDLIFEAGFNSVPTYYRCRKQLNKLKA